MGKKLRCLLVLVTAILLTFVTLSDVNASSEENAHSTGGSDFTQKNWIGTWTASPQPPYSDGISNKGFHQQTIRMVIHPHMDGDVLRIHLSNIFGLQPLTFGEVHVARSAGSSKIVPETDHQVTFDEEHSVTIPDGEEVVSDPVPLEVKSGEDLTVSVYVPESSGSTTWHLWSKQTSYIASGNHTSEQSGISFDYEENSWFWLDAVDVEADSSVKGAIVTLGDSITDVGHSTLNTNHRWPDFLAERFSKLPKYQQFSVLNAGISGNEILEQSPTGGVSALERIDRDVLSQSGVTDIILLEGINDILNQPSASADEIIEGMEQIIGDAHDHGLNIYGATLTPFKGYVAYTLEKEAIREDVNRWIRTSDAFDGVIDFDKAIRDPRNPHRMLPKYNADDHLHPGDDGLKAMADSIDITMFGVVENVHDIRNLIDSYEKAGEFTNHEAVHALDLQLTTINHFEKKKVNEKVLKHLKGLMDLLDHQEKEDVISNEAYRTLQDIAKYLIKKYK